MRAILLLPLLILSGHSTGDTSAQAVDHPFQPHMEFMEGTWRTENPFRTDDNGQPPYYVMRWELGIAGASLHGILWGDFGDDSTVTYWEFSSVWDPVARKAFIYQESPWGSMGVGEQSLESDGTSLQLVLVHPDGTREMLRDTETELTRDSIATYSSRQLADGTWSERRGYLWERVR